MYLFLQNVLKVMFILSFKRSLLNQIGMDCSFVSSEDMSRSENIFEKVNLKKIYLHIKLHMVYQIISVPESLIAVVAGDDYSFQMISFNVIFNSTAVTLLSTDFAHKSSLKSIRAQVLTYPHHRLHLFVKIILISSKVMRRCYFSV